MKNLLLSACCLVAFAANAEEYRLVGQRHLRLYTAADMTQSYNAAVDAQAVADSLCNVPWTVSRSVSATSTSHVNEQLDANVEKRDQFDAALFCAYHTNGTHKAFANAAVYRYRLPDGQLPNLTRLSARVSSDPYNAEGARIVLYTNESGIIPTDCATCRGENSGGIKLAALAQRITRRASDGKDYWYPATTNAVFTVPDAPRVAGAGDLPSGGLQLQRYLFVFVLLENYASSRGNWLEGCSYIENLVSITTDAPVSGWTDGSTVDLSQSGPVTAPDEWMPRFETTNTVITAVREGVTQQFAAPEYAWRLVHFGSTNLTLATHLVSQFDGEVWTRGAAVTNPAGWTVTQVLRSRRVSVSGHDVYLERGFESAPPSLGDVRTDSDGDGIPDGWEIYVGSDPNDPSDATSDWDGDGLTLAEEYDHGYHPTNPRDADTDRDGIIDRYAWMYHLKGDDSAKDFDGDGLSNYEEYFISEVLMLCKLDPDNPKTNGFCVDRYRKFGELYLGEVFSYPQPMTNEGPATVTARICSPKNGKAVVKAYGEKYDPNMVNPPDATWTVDVRVGTHDYVLDASSVEYGKFRPGRYSFSVYMSKNGEDFSPGESIGIARSVDVGWKHAQFEVALSKHDAITPRIALWDDADDRSVTVGDINEQLLNNELNHVSETNIEDFINARIDTLMPPPAGKTAHIRVVRYAIDDMFCYNVGVGSENDGYDQIVVVDKTFDPASRKFLCEADFLADGQFDIDWGTLTGTDYRKGAIVDVDGNVLGGDRGPAGAGCGVTNMSYLVVIGDGPKDFGFKYDTNTVRALKTVVTRRFELNRSRPVVDSTHQTFFSARPTFTWSMPNEESWAREFGSSYTAFRLQILEYADTRVVVYDSGIVRAPKQDKDGNFVWTAPICAGSVTPQGKIFSAVGTYKWHVTMYNAKFRSEDWSSSVESGLKPYGLFTMAVNSQQDVNDRGSSMVKVAVKYTGPTNVLAKSANVAELKGKVRVQAFATADFTGEPLAEAVVTNEIADVTKTTANAKLLGLPVGSTYYVRAYIDMNGNGRKDDWESWSYAQKPIELKTSDRIAQTVGLYIEDADTDQDWLPDAWEYAYGEWPDDFADIKNDLNTLPEKSRVIAVTDTLAAALASEKLAAGISSGLPGVTLSTLQSPDFAEALLGLGQTASIDDIRDKVEKKVRPNSVKITSLTMAEDQIVLTVDADVAYEIAGMPLNLVYDFTDLANVTLRIWKKNTLLDAQWTKVGADISVSFQKGQEKVEVDTRLSGETVNFSSGFYKVEVVE